MQEAKVRIPTIEEFMSYLSREMPEIQLSKEMVEEYLRKQSGYEEQRKPVLRAMRNNFSRLNQQYFFGIEKVLEVGSGTGFLRKNWPGFGGLWVELDDILTYLEIARKKSPRGTFVSADFNELPFPDGTFDAVMEFNSYSCGQNLESAVMEASRVLRKGGIFLHMMDLPAAREEGSEMTKEASMKRNNKLRERLVELLSIHFDSSTIKADLSRTIYEGKRTDEQRKTGNYLFFHDTVRNVVGSEPYLFDDTNPLLCRLRKWTYQALRKVSPRIAQFSEPPCVEYSKMSYVMARK